MALSKLYTDTSGVMKGGVSESVRVPDTSVVKNQGKSWPGHASCGVSRNIRVLILNDISAKTMSTFDGEVKCHENLNLRKIKLYFYAHPLT